MLRWNEVTWYSKLGAAIVIFGVLPVLSFYIGIQYDQVMNPPTVIKYTAQEPSVITKAEASRTSSKAAWIRIPISKDEFTGVRSSTTLSVPASTTIVTLRRPTPLSGSRNESYDVLINGVPATHPKDLGAGGLGVADVEFSQDNSYLAFRTMFFTGGNRRAYHINILDFARGTVFAFNDPHVQDYISEYQDSAGTTIVPLVTYHWNPDNSLNIIFFYVEIAADTGAEDGYSRISPKEVWRYDLVAKKYTFLETLPE